MQRGIECGSLRVNVDLFDQEKNIAYFISKPVLNSDYRDSQILHEAQKVLVKKDISENVIPEYLKAQIPIIDKYMLSKEYEIQYRLLDKRE